jgi:hypothetical protein
MRYSKTAFNIESKGACHHKGVYMIKLKLFLLIFLVSTGLFAQNVSLDQALQTSSQTVVTQLPQGTKVAVLTFTASSQSFSNYVIDEIATSISNGNRLQVETKR